MRSLLAGWPCDCCISLLCAHLVQAQAPVQPPNQWIQARSNGEIYYFINQLSGLQMDLNDDATTPGSPILQNTRSFSDLSQRWATSRMPDGNWKISNILSGLCLDSTGGASPKTVENPCALNVTTQEWTFTYASNYAAYASTANGYNAITTWARARCFQSPGLNERGGRSGSGGALRRHSKRKPTVAVPSGVLARQR